MADSFKGLTVIELGRVFSGPLCGQLLADLGARVIKIEQPEYGDESRHFGVDAQNGYSSYFNSLNRNKHSLELNLKNPDDQECLKNLIVGADVLVHNWIQETLDTYGFSYATCKALNPRLIYCSISGFGYAKAESRQPSQDIIAQAVSGLLSLTGDPAGLPMRTGIPVVDYVTGLYAGFSIMSALFQRETSQVGQLVHVSLLESALAMTSFATCSYLAGGPNPQRNGNRHPSISPYNVYASSNGHVVIAVANQAMWERFCQVLDLNQLCFDPRFKNNTLRLQHCDALEQIIEAKLKELDTAEILERLHGGRISGAAVNTIAQALECSAVQDLEMINVDNGAKKLTLLGKAFHLENAELVENHAPPALGEHNHVYKKPH